MIGRGLFIVTVLSNCVLSLPVTSSQLENEDVKVMKCIVEALADVLSRPHPVPVSQECLVILRTDDRLVTILRHQNFLKELQEIAVHGGQERAQVQRDAAAPAAMKQTPLAADNASDRSMLEALGSTSERSILSQKRKAENREGGGEEKGESLKDGEDSLEDSADIMEETPMKRDEDEESPGSHVSESVDEWSAGKDGKREDEDEEEEEEEEKKAHSEESSEENLSKKEKGAASEEKRDAPRHKSKEQTLGEEDEEEEEEEEEEDKRSSFISDKHEEEEEGDVKRGSKESTKQWNKRGKGLRLKKKADGKEAREPGSHQEVAHHSKEAAEDEEGKKKRDAQKSPEEKELQMIAGRTPEERKGLEEEGSASRKSEEPEIESLAAIESELENVAQKLHELRRG